MRSPLARALALLSIGAALAACTDRPDAPTGPNAAKPLGAHALTLTGSCDVTQLKSDGKAEASKANDVLLTYIGDISTALRADAAVPNGPVPGPAATDKAFDALSRIAVIRGTSDQKSTITPDVFDRLVKGLLLCMSSNTYANAADLPAGGFGNALGKNWVFEVRGKTTSPADPTGPAFERGSIDNTWWVFDKNATTWGDAISSNWAPDRVFIYGYRTNFLSGYNLVGGSSFEHRTIPKTIKPNSTNPFFTVAAIVGLCYSDGTVTPTSTQRVNHNGQFLALTSYGACSTPPAFTPIASLASATFSPRVLANRVASFFAPQSLYAATFFAGGSVTGSPDDFSPSAVYDLSGLQLFKPDSIADGVTSQPLQLKTGGPITLKVNVTGTTQPAPDGTPVTVSISGNSSTIAFFADGSATATPSVTVTRYTTGGVVTFNNLYLTKSGGYTLAFQITAPPPATAVGPMVTTNSFQMQNK